MTLDFFVIHVTEECVLNPYGRCGSRRSDRYWGSSKLPNRHDRILINDDRAWFIDLLCFCLIRPGRHPKIPFSKILEVVSRPEFAQDHGSGAVLAGTPKMLICTYTAGVLTLCTYTGTIGYLCCTSLIPCAAAVSYLSYSYTYLLVRYDTDTTSTYK
jgi:hypothetical protein